MSKTAEDIRMGVSTIVVRNNRARVKDQLISRFIFLNGVIAIVAILSIFAFLLKDSFPLIHRISPWKFISGTAWQPEFEVFGIMPLLMGSLFVTLGAIIISVPIGIACAIYLAEVAPKWIREILKPTIEVLAGIPSVVIGFIGLTVIAPVVQQLLSLPIGTTALTGSVVLAFMAMPTIISIAEDSIVAVPKSYRQGSMALGASHWETIRGVVVPAAKSGIIAACMLGIGRAIGETMTVLMVAGNASNIPGPINNWLAYFTGPVRTMTAAIAQETPEAARYSTHYHALFAVGLVLFLITFVINLTADMALKRVKH